MGFPLVANGVLSDANPAYVLEQDDFKNAVAVIHPGGAKQGSNLIVKKTKDHNLTTGNHEGIHFLRND